MQSSFTDVCRFNPSAGGTTDWTYSSAVTGYQSPTAAGAVSGNQYSYRSESADLSQWEIGTGVWNGAVLTRAAVLFNSAGTTAKIAFSAAPQVALVALAEDLLPQDAPQGRLTLVTATPVMSSSQASKTTVYYTPYVGSRLPLYDGASWRMVSFVEMSIATTDTAKSPAALGASKVNDWFYWNDAGTLRIIHGPDWTSDTVRSAGTALVMQDGILMNAVAITNGPAIKRGIYIGTTRANGSSAVDWVYGSSAVGGGSAAFGVFNAYNRVSVATGIVTDSTVSWTYGVNGVFRATNGQNGMRVSMVFGLAEDAVWGSFSCYMTNGAASGGVIGIALDTTTTNVGTATGGGPINTSCPLSSAYSGTPGIGFHFLQALEYSAGTGSTTFYGSNSTPAVYGNSLTATMRM